MDSNLLFSDDFVLGDLNPEGKKFEKVDRLMGKGRNFDADLLLDVHSELFEVTKDAVIHVALLSAQTDGRPMPQEELDSRLKTYDYAMHGIVYKCKNLKDDRLEIHVSHGGLLARLIGKETDLGKLDVDANVYTLVRKTT